MTPVVSIDERRAGRRRRGLRWLIALGVVVLAAAAAWLVWFSPVLAIREVRVVGATGAPAKAVLQSAAVPVGLPLARLDAQAIADRLSTVPWVGTVEVRRGWPSTVVLAVQPRVPVARMSGDRVVDAAGVAYVPISAAPTGLPEVEAEDVALVAAMRVLTGLPPDLRGRVASLRATTRDDVELTLRSGALVRWGSAEQGDFKAQVLVALLPRRARAYDVSAPELPTTFAERPRRTGAAVATEAPAG